VRELAGRRQRLREQVESLQARVEQMPRTEQELATLTRDFNQLRENYQALLRKKMEAQTAERLQRRWTEDFEILDQAQVPEHHVFPNRRLFVLAGVVLGLALGLGAAVLAELFSPYVLNLDDLESTVPVPVLAVLPRVARDEAARAARHLAAESRARGRPARHPRP
jgi:capsular polysaccharide biosynthesis protein